MKTNEVISLAISGSAFAVSMVSFLYSYLQMQFLRNQIKVGVDAKIYDVHRELIKLGFDHEELFDILNDKPLANTAKQYHYVQLWLNHIDIMWFAWSSGFISSSTWHSVEKDIVDFFALEIVREQWSKVREFYRPEFAQYIAKKIRPRQ